MAVKLEPHVGIAYLVEGQLLLDTTPLGEAGEYLDFKIHERSHLKYWAELVSKRLVPDVEYEELPRGRAVFNTKSGMFTLYADRCILGRKDVVKKLIANLHLPKGETKTETDAHYRCAACLRRDPEAEL
jgi:hypothetical protein